MLESQSHASSMATSLPIGSLDGKLYFSGGTKEEEGVVEAENEVRTASATAQDCEAIGIVVCAQAGSNDVPTIGGTEEEEWKFGNEKKESELPVPCYAISHGGTTRTEKEQVVQEEGSGEESDFASNEKGVVADINVIPASENQQCDITTIADESVIPVRSGSPKYDGPSKVESHSDDLPGLVRRRRLKKTGPPQKPEGHDRHGASDGTTSSIEYSHGKDFSSKNSNNHFSINLGKGKREKNGTSVEDIGGFATSNCSAAPHDSSSFSCGGSKEQPGIAIRSNAIFGDSDSGSDSDSEKEGKGNLFGGQCDAVSDESDSGAAQTQEHRERFGGRKMDISSECYSETPVVMHERTNGNGKGGRTAEQVKAEELREARKSVTTDDLTKWIQEKQSSLIFKDMDELKRLAISEQESLADRLRTKIEHTSHFRSQAAKEELAKLKFNVNDDDDKKLERVAEKKGAAVLNETPTTGLLQRNEELNENSSCTNESDEEHIVKPENRDAADIEAGKPGKCRDTDEEDDDELNSLVIIPPTTKQKLALKKATHIRELITTHRDDVNNKRKPVLDAARSSRHARGELIGRLRTKCISQANTRWAKMLDSSYKDGKEMLHDFKYAELMRRERSEKERQRRIAAERRSAAHAKEFRDAADSEEEELEFDDASPLPQTPNMLSLVSGTTVERVMEEGPASDSCKSFNSDEALNSSSSSLSIRCSSPPPTSDLITPIPVEIQEIVHESSSDGILVMDPIAMKPEPTVAVVPSGTPSIQSSSLPQPSPASLDLKQRTYGRNRNRGQIGVADGTQVAVEGGGSDSTVTKMNDAPDLEVSDVGQSGDMVKTVKHSSERQDVSTIANESYGGLRENGVDHHHHHSISYIPEDEDEAALPEVPNDDRDGTIETPSFFDRVKAAIDNNDREGEKKDNNVDVVSYKNDNGPVAVDVSAGEGIVVCRERNAGYRAILDAERWKHKKMAKFRKHSGNVIDEEAEEDEEESAVQGLGDFGFGVMTGGNKDAGDGGKEEENMDDDKVTAADLEGIVDTYSDDEGDEDAAISFRGREAAERDKATLRSVLRQVKEGFGEARLGGRSAFARGALRTDQLTAAARSSRKEAKRLGLLNSDEEWSENEQNDGRESEDDLDEHELAEMVEREQRLRHMGLSEMARDALNSSDESDADEEEGENGKDAPMKDEMDIAEERMIKKWAQKAKIRRVLSELQDLNNDEDKGSLFHSLEADSTSQDVLSALQFTNSNMGISGQGKIRGVNKHNTGTYHGGKLRDGELQVGCVNVRSL